MLDVLVRKLEGRDRLTEAQRQALLTLPFERRKIEAGALIIREGGKIASSSLLVSGFAGRFALLDNGGRQFTQLGLPGDFMDLHSLLLKRLEHGVLAISACEVSAVPHAALRALLAKDDHLARLLWLETVVDAAVHRAWLVGLGRQNAPARIAHLLCETFARLKAVSLVQGASFDFPLNQSELADVVGLSSVHVNRTLMMLRAADLMEWRDGRVTINDWDGLARLAEFDPLYLRLWREAV